MSLIPFILDLADELHEFSRCLANGIDINDFGFGLYTGTDQQQPPQHQQQPQQQQQQPHQQPQTSPRRSRTSSFSSFWMPSKRHHPYNRIKTACCAKSGEEAVATPEKSEASSSSIGGTPGKSASYSVVNKNGFQVSMNVKQFAPNELSVKTIDNCIVVEGRHDDKEDGHGVISRHFVRKYMLPKGYDPNDVLSTLSSDGILTVKAPPPPPPTAKNDEPNERIIEIQPTPGPTPVLVVSAKDTPAKETSKKLPTTPSARLECQLPEKRQKLDLPPEPEPEESAEAPAPVPTATTTETDSASLAAAGTVVEANDVDMEKADEQINEVVLKQTEPQQQKSDVVASHNEVEKTGEIKEQKEKEREHEHEQDKTAAETEKKLLDECMSDTNGDSKNAGEMKMEMESSSAKDVTQATEQQQKTKETSPAATKVEDGSVENVTNVTKMEVDGEDEGRDDDGDNKTAKTDNTKVVVATIKTADTETKTAVKAAAGADSAKNNSETEKTNNNTETSSSSSSSSSSNTSTTTTTNTNTTITNNNNNNNNNNTSTNSNTSTTTTTNTATTTTNNNSASTEVATENSVKDVKGGNGVVTGELPVDIPKSDDSDAATNATATATATAAAATATAKTKACVADSKAESVPDGEVDIETAVLSTEPTTNIIDDVALLKAATADPADITDNAEENAILTESMDGITATTDSNTNTNTTTAATTVDNVECSLFAKKSHLGNGNNTTATPIVGTEEMAN